MTKLEGLGESELLRRIKPYLAANSPEGVEIPAGDDDAAVWRDGDGFLVASCDTSVEGVHFDLTWMSPEDAGWRALALALGDLAAKGATPWWALVAVAAPKTWSADAFVGLYRGIDVLAHKVDLQLAGGDMSSIDGPAVLTITVAGRTSTRPLARSQARPGWSVAVSGPLGAAKVALAKRHALRLEPRFAEGRRLNAAGLCCGDISDGLVREMHKFADMSGVGCILRADEVPVADGASIEDAMTSGEEAELVCVGPEEVVRGAGLRPIGVLTDDPGIRVVGEDGQPVHLMGGGYDHFA
jgi:thiamine-monophosphate kinase